LLKSIAECGWQFPKDVTAESFGKWRAKQTKLAAKTLNDYLADCRNFINWIRHAMGIMRHSDMRLTNSTYTDEAHLPLAEAISKLPKFWESQLNAPENAPKLVERGLKESSGVHSGVRTESDETLENTGYSPLLSPAVPSGTNEKLVAGLGFEPRTFRL
jgi:hypothetical protein